MTWGRSYNEGRMQRWHEVLNIALSARWPTTTGKPLANNTYMILDGTREKPIQVRLKYHCTNIIVWKPEGDIFICTGWDTITTKQQLSKYGGTSIFQKNLPALNGYAVSPEKRTFITVRGVPGEVPFDGNASVGHDYDNYLRITPERKWDMSTVKSIEVQLVVEPEKLRKVMLHLGKVSQLALGYAKLAGDRPWEGEVNMQKWLVDRMNVPLEDINLRPFPYASNPKTDFKTALGNIRWNIARNAGWLSTASLLR